MKKSILVGLAGLCTIGAVFLGSAASVSAHPTPNDRRTVAQCRDLQLPAKRRACLACLARPSPHHYHPAAPAGHRCRPNNGQP